MKILVASLRQETNSFSPVRTSYKDFTVAKGSEMLEKIAATSVFEEAGVKIIPTLCAYALPSGKVDKECYTEYKEYILAGIPENEKIEGVWLYLHGAMEVEEIGSGEALLVAEIRKKVGPYVPIAVALDFHANNTERLVDSANIIYGYRTVPHEDAKETQIRTARMLLDCIREGILPKPVMVRVPLLFPGEMATTVVEPSKSLIKELDIIEMKEDILCASLFTGMPWVDTPNSGGSIVIVGKSETESADREARRLAGMFWDARKRFHFEEEAAEPEEAVERAVKAKENPVFISDSGDNVTAGAAGDNAYFLNLLLKSKTEKTLVAGITDSRIVKLCSGYSVADTVYLNLGAELDETSEYIEVTGVLKAKGRLSGGGGKAGSGFVVVNIEGIDTIITEERHSFTSAEIIESVGVKLAEYRIVVVKLGYLFPELRKISKRSILALTPGSSSLALERLEFRRVNRPVYPLDKDFTWSPFRDQ